MISSTLEHGLIRSSCPVLTCRSPIQFLTSGGGSKAWRGVYSPKNADKLRFFYDGQGFMSLQVTRDGAEVAFHDASGAVLHRWRGTKELLHPAM